MPGRRHSSPRIRSPVSRSSVVSQTFPAPASDAASASEARYLSGLLLGIGLTFWACVPTIERRGAVVRALAAIVVVGGLARLAGAVQTGFPPSVSLPLVMEIAVTPLVALWRERVEQRLST